MPTKICENYKYRINDMLSNLPVKDYYKALKVIPKVIGVSTNTFTNYRNIRLDDPRDIPYQKVAMLELIFGLQPGGLRNFPVECKPLSELLVEFNQN